MRPLQEEIIKCKELISEIYIEKYNQEQYAQIVYEIFDQVFVNYFDTTCPDKIEPNYLPKRAVNVLRQKHAKNQSKN
jgi:hypothetical protein